ncbi:hypothetical protein GCM10010112_33730 [Actinoplanes lobatus]|uniref:Uncharacterized protein n=2 Tax=Actinoplanes lobatus TaxID=113568 RepID=A0ABQ4AML2_9ACTN|nr:hypothetical protein GCM10010112_33730 [Actinoplanes lobatus]GIE42173.1 hypothetical protein Alo02nite_50710 [Actinoplanes lobatus]
MRGPHIRPPSRVIDARGFDAAVFLACGHMKRVRMTSVLAAVTLSLAACGSPQAATDGGSGPLKVGIVYSY